MKDQKLELLLMVQSICSEKLARHATRSAPNKSQQKLQDRLFSDFDRITACISAYLDK